MKKIAFVALPLTMVLAACGGTEPAADETVVVDPAVTTTEPLATETVAPADTMTTDTMATDGAMTTDTTMTDGDATMTTETEVAE